MIQEKNKEIIAFLSTIIFAILLFLYILFGLTGVRVMTGMLFILIPSYLILNNFKLNFAEKIVYSFFAGVGIFSSIVYWLGTIISFRLAILITFILLVVLGFALRRFWKK